MARKGSTSGKGGNAKDAKAKANPEPATPPVGETNPELADQLLAAESSAEVEDLAPADAEPQWKQVPWSGELIEEWRKDPEFLEYCSKNGIPLGPAEPIAQMAGNFPKGGLDLNDMGQVMAFIQQTVAAQLTMAQQTGMGGQKEKDTKLVKFPDPIEIPVEGQDGSKTIRKVPLWPIYYAQEIYQDTGFYKAEVADYLQEEIDGARFVEIPQGTAFVDFVFVVKNKKGETDRIRQPFYAPGVFAWKSLAESVERQVNSLIDVVIPEGLIEGTKVKYSEVITNGVRMVPGYRYLVPEVAARDVLRRIRDCESSYRHLGLDRGQMGTMGRIQEQLLIEKQRKDRPISQQDSFQTIRDQLKTVPAGRVGG